MFLFCSIVEGSESKRFCCFYVVVEFACFLVLFIYFNWGFGFSFVLEV